MKYIRGFLMAWGMFCWIPCPYKKWREDDRKAMVAMLPLLGTCMGAILCLCWWALSLIGAGQFISGGLLTGAYFLMTGFIHLDGFMDCSDATLPRHAEMETRVRILKDSHSGAFAVICVTLMMIIFAAAMVEIAPNFSLKGCALIVVIFTFSRFMSAMYVLTCEPMKTSQYASQASDSGENEQAGDAGIKQNPYSAKHAIPAFVIALLVLAAAEWVWSGGNYWALIAELYSNIVAVVVILAAGITGNLDRKMLGGMNGDISGHMITMSEMFGVIALALIIK